MAKPATVFEPVDDDAAEFAAMTAAVEKARANRRVYRSGKSHCSATGCA